jgi:GNAT superfamily N-acetyltransferase
VAAALGGNGLRGPVTLDRMEVVPHTDAEEFARFAHPLLAPDPVRHTSVLSVLHGVRGGTVAPAAMLTVHEGGATVGALLRTAQRPALVSGVPPGCADAVADTLTGLDPDLNGAQGRAEEAEAFAAAWTARTGTSVQVAMRMRLFALDELRPPAGVPGAARIVPPDDDAGIDLLAAWRAAFDAELDAGWPHPHTSRDQVARELAAGAGELVWEVDGVPVAQAAARAVTAGMSRIGPVYTLPDQRGRGYGAAVTAAASRWALNRGARNLLIYTDLANPTTNRLYPRLGYRPRYDALELLFVLAGTETVTTGQPRTVAATRPDGAGSAT